MPIGAALIGGGLSLFGNILGGNAAADAERKRAEALRQNSLEQRFSPIGMTNRFGTSTSQIDPATGKVIGAGYSLSPELKAFQDRFMTQGGGGLTQIENAPGMYAPLTGAAQSMYNLGGQYLAESPEQVAAKYMAQQQDLLAPSRERSMAQLQQNMFNTGTTGLSVGATGTRPGGGMGLSSANPQMEAYYNAQAQQDRQLGLDAERFGMDRYKFGQGLFQAGTNTLGDYYKGQTGAYEPFNAALGSAQGLEGLGRMSYQDMIAMGKANMGGSNAAGINSQFAADAYSPFGAAASGFGGSSELSSALAKYLRQSGPGSNAPPYYDYALGGAQ
jgi:hypothetical protein